MYGPTGTLQKSVKIPRCLTNLHLKYIRETVRYIRDMILKLNTCIQKHNACIKQYLQVNQK